MKRFLDLVEGVRIGIVHLLHMHPMPSGYLVPARCQRGARCMSA